MAKIPPCDLADHRWLPTKLDYRLKCEYCATLFPCAEHDCGHYDCITQRFEYGIRTACHACRKTLELQEGSIAVGLPDGRWVRYDRVVVRGALRAVCPRCLGAPPVP